MRPASGVLSAWLARRNHGLWPRAGGWDDQPLALLVKLEVLDFAYNTLKFMNSKNAEWDLVTTLQRDLKVWIEKD